MFSKCLQIIVLIFAINTFSYAQSIATASVSATITSLVGTERGGDLNFTLKPVSKTAMTLLPSEENHVKVSPKTGEYKLNAATFKIIGSSQLYDIYLPSREIILSNRDGNEAALIKDFKFTSSRQSGISLNEEVLTIDATLKSTPSFHLLLNTRHSFEVVLNFN